MEVDGGIHNHEGIWQEDARREAALAERGVTVVRLTNEDVFVLNADALYRRILLSRWQTSLITPSPPLLPRNADTEGEGVAGAPLAGYAGGVREGFLRGCGEQKGMQRVVTFGEVMLRLSPPGYLRLLQANTLEMTFGGAEVNVAVSLAHFGLDAAFVTRLPKNDVAQAFINQIRGLGVDTSKILRGGERMGVYFVEKGAAQRASTVLYDRAHSAIAEIDPAELDWDMIFAGAVAFHVTGITPALSDSAAAAAISGARAAKAKGITVTCDLNYRKKLWTSEKAGQVMGELLPSVDYCIANEEDAETVFGIKAADSDLTGGHLSHDGYIEVAQKLIARFPNLKGVAVTLRESFSASRNGWSGMLFADGEAHFSQRYEIDIVDRVGGGDSFAAGLIYSLVKGKSPQECIQFAVAASCLKHSIVGDFSYIKLAEVETLLKGDGSGRVQR